MDYDKHTCWNLPFFFFFYNKIFLFMHTQKYEKHNKTVDTSRPVNLHGEASAFVVQSLS